MMLSLLLNVQKGDFYMTYKYIPPSFCIKVRCGYMHTVIYKIVSITNIPKTV